MIRHSFDVIPKDDTDLSPGPVKAILVSGAGNVAVVLEKDSNSTVRVFALSPGIPLTGFVIRRVMATDTTATGVVALY